MGTCRTADIAVVGAGAGGLALILHLARCGVLSGGCRVVVLDPEVHPFDEVRPPLPEPEATGQGGAGPARRPAVLSGTETFDSRVWGFWDTAQRPVLPETGTRFTLLRFHAAGSSLRLPLAPYRFRVVRGADLRRLTTTALADLAGTPGPPVTYLPHRVHTIIDGPQGALVEHDAGTLSARWVLDSSGLAGSASSPSAVMAFRGWEITTDRRRLDEQVPTLFDFRGMPPGSFGYQVPLGPGRSLIEVTRITTVDDLALPDPEPYARETLGLDEYDVIRTEQGRLPLVPWHARPNGRHVLSLGTTAGMIKASSGFALARIHRDSAAVARSFVRYRHPFGVPTPRWRHGLFDATLLNAVLRDPDLLERAFGVLARDPALLMRFLDEDTTVPQELRIAVRMPPGRFMNAGVRALVGASRLRPQASTGTVPGPPPGLASRAAEGQEDVAMTPLETTPETTGWP